MKTTSAIRVASIFLIALAITASASAIVTKTENDNSTKQFEEGTPKGTAVTSFGKVTLGLAAEKLTDIEADIIWSTAVGPDGRLYLGTGHEGKIFAVTKKGKVEVYCFMDEFEVTSLAFGPDGALYAGTAPKGRIYRITDRDEKSLYYDTEQDAVWKIAINSKGVLYAGTGPNGKIFKVTKREKGEVFFTAEAKNITDIIFDKAGNLLCATHDKTFVIKVDEKGKGFVLYQADQVEARSLTLDLDGNLYAALNAGGRAPADDYFSAPTLLGVIMSGGDPGGNGDPSSPPDMPTGQSIAAMMSSKPSSNGKGKTQIVRISPEGFVDPLWPAAESPIHQILYDPEPKALIVAAGDKGRLFSVDAMGRHKLLLTTEQKYTTAFSRLDDLYLLAAAKETAIFAVPVKPQGEGEFISRVLDAKDTVQWGSVSIVAETPEGSEIKFAFRSGNTDKPDEGWSEWGSAAAPKNNRVNVDAPVARYLQYKAVLKSGSDGTSPAIDKVSVHFTQPNRPPEVRDLIVGVGIPRGGRPGMQQPSMPISMPMMQNQNSRQKNNNKNSKANTNQGKMNLRWSARDLNGDTMTYDIYLRGEGESRWILIDEDIDKPVHIFDASTIPDGLYRVKVVASDRPSNNPGEALEAEVISDQFAIDNDGPEFVELAANVTDKSVAISITAEDALSQIAELEYKLNSADRWQQVIPVDLMLDNLRETFNFKLDDCESGDHILAVRVTDSIGNTTIEKIVFSVE